MTPIRLDEKFALFSEHWRPKTIARLNGQEVKLIKVLGVFPWHRHEAEDELFLVWRGVFRVEFRDRVVTLGPGELVVVPAWSIGRRRMMRRRCCASSRRGCGIRGIWRTRRLRRR